MKRLLIAPILFTSLSVWGQKFTLKDNGTNIEKKLSSALRYDYTITVVDSADYQLEVFFRPKKGSLGKYAAYYKIFNKNGVEIYKSEEWKSGQWGGQAENYFVKQIVNKDLPKFLKANYSK